MDNFTHWHVHTTYSFLDGYCVPSKLAKKAKDLGMTHLAMTDHNTLAGVYEFEKACDEHGITPIYGLEGYSTWNTDILSANKKERDKIAQAEAEKHERNAMYATNTKGKEVKTKNFKKIVDKYQYDTRQYHILFLALNQNGWKNLIKIQAEASKQCTFNGRYLVDERILRKYNEDVICTTACIGGMIPALALEGRLDEAEEQIDIMHEIFEDRFYLEIQPLNIEKQWVVNDFLIKMANKKGIKLVATNDVHYINEEDHDEHDTLLCMGTGRLKKDPSRMKYSNDFWLRSYEEMVEAFTNQAICMRDYLEDFDLQVHSEAIREAMSNTGSILDQVEKVTLGSDKPLLPEFAPPERYSSVEQYLTIKCYEELYKYKSTHPEINLKEYEDRLQYELYVINTKGYASYMLIVEDFVKNSGCATGPGRGSAAGSLVLFLLEITKVDPIKYNLLFFRFLTPDRTALPDIDMDFDYYHRDDVIRYLENKYGHNKVAHIGTYTRLGVKNGIKDIGRALDYPFQDLNRVTKEIDNILDIPSIKFKDLDGLEASNNPADKKAWDKFCKLEEKYSEIFSLARKFEGIPRNMGVHASGILVTPGPVIDVVPVRTHKDGTTVCLFDGDELEELNLVKFDILGLKTVSLMKMTLEQATDKVTIDDLFKQMDFDGPELYEMINDMQTEGLFQIESNLFKRLIKDIKPDSFGDIVALTAIARPGPLSAEMHIAYGRRKHGDEDAVEPLNNTWDITKNSYGTIIYQEQIMQIAQEVAGVDDNQADSYYRKAIARKNIAIMNMCRQWFIYGKINEAPPEHYDSSNINQPMYDETGEHGSPIVGGINNGYDEGELSVFWTQMEGYASYLFNLSHAVSYSFITIACTYLKKYYPVEYMANLLTITEKDEDIERYIEASEKMNISISTPDINKSEKGFSVSDGSILYGLSGIKGMGETKVDEIIKNRPYESLSDVTSKLPKKIFNKAAGRSAIMAGCFDFEDKNRHTMLNRFIELRKVKKEIEEDMLNEQDYTADVCMEFEREILSVELTHKPWWRQAREGQTITREFEVVSVSEIYDKNNNLMAFVSAESGGCAVEMVVFSYVYAKLHDLFDSDRHKSIMITGKKDAGGKLLVSKASSIKS